MMSQNTMMIHYSRQDGSLEYSIDISNEFRCVADVEMSSNRVAVAGHDTCPTDARYSIANVVVYSLDTGDKIYSAFQEMNCLWADLFVLQKKRILICSEKEKKKSISAFSYWV